MEAPRFAHAAERECASLFDFFGLRWQYEPRTFPLVVDDLGRVRSAFTPDFYLVDLDLYVEVTTQRSSLVSRKRQKMRLLEERFPGVRVQLFTRGDVERLGRAHGLRAA